MYPMPDNDIMTYNHVSAAPISQRSESTEERVPPESPGRNPAATMDKSPEKPIKYESTEQGDIRTVVEGSSFDAEDGTKEQQQQQKSEPEITPIKKHTRDLSAHFFESTRLSDEHFPSQQPRRTTSTVEASPIQHSSSMAPYSSAVPPSPANVGQKHRRGFSGDVSNPSMAHRRINSIGNSTFVNRQVGYYHPPPAGSYPHNGQQQTMAPPAAYKHRREDSAGLDMLTLAANVSKEELAVAAGSRPKNWPQQPRERMSPSAVSSASSVQAPPPRSGRYQQGAGHYSSQHYHHSYPSYYPPAPGHYRGMGPSSPSHYPVQFAPPRGGGGETYPTKTRDGRIETEETLFSRGGGGTTQGVQTYVTSIGVGDGTRTMNAAPTHRSAATNTEGEHQHPPIPSSIGSSRQHHHRKLSSFSSLATIAVGPGFSEPVPEGAANKHAGHYRDPSSISFLGNLDNTDDIFLSHLQAPAHDYPPTYSPPPKAVAPPETKSSVNLSKTGASGRKLAKGGTSKRVRRKCTIENCPNRVVQGGLCIAHGAKRKQCKHPGCTKNVKKAGLCSTHGPSRKRCEADGCSKVAVQGGRCIAHGAKKKLCSMEGCSKQAIMAGMCKKHHDQNKGAAAATQRRVVPQRRAPPRKSDEDEEQSAATCVVIQKPTDDASSIAKSATPKPSHQRGISIFQEMSVDTVQTLLSTDEQTEEDAIHPLKI